MKRAIVVLWTVMAANVWASQSKIVDGVTWYYEAFSDGGKVCARIISGPVKYAGDLTIPATLGDYPVTIIKPYAFQSCSGLTSVTIPSSVTSIGEYAFSYCLGLESVTISDGVASIGDYAFQCCRGLTSVTIPSSVMSLGRGVFSICSGLTHVTVPFVGSKRGNTGTVDSLFGYIFGTEFHAQNLHTTNLKK